MDDGEADAVTRHLVTCKPCRTAVAEARGTTDPKGQEAVTVEFPQVPKPGSPNRPPVKPEKPAAAKPGAAKPGTEKSALVKVRCQTCNARYGIPQERVRGRLLKIRCKSCGSTIEVWSSDGAIKSVIDRGKKLWFLVVKRQRVGPMTEQEVRERIERGEVKPRTYAWRQGFSKWERLYDIPEFKDLAAGPLASINSQPTRKAPVPEGDPDRTEKARPPRSHGPHVQGSASSEELNFDNQGEVGDSGMRTAYVPAGAPAAAEGQVTHIHLGQRDPLAGLDQDADLKATTARASDLDAASEASWDQQFADPGANPDPPSRMPDPRLHSGEWDQHMKGQRHDDSVLFSLGHLHKLAGQTAKPDGPQVNTGLFNIRPSSASPASALLLPEEGSRKPGGAGLILLVAVVGVVLGAGVLLGILYLVQPQLVGALLAGHEVAPVSSPRPDAALLASAGGEVTPVAPIAPSRPDARIASPPDAGSEVDLQPPEPDAQPSRPTRVDRPRVRPRVTPPVRVKKPRPPPGDIDVVDPDRDDPPDVSSDPVEPKVEPTPKTARPKKGPAELDQLIDDATGPGEVGKKPRKKPPAVPSGDPAAEPVAPRPSREQVAAGMKLAEPGVKACYAQFREPGIVMVATTIDGSSGRVSQARAVGPFAGTPSGDCVVQVVRARVVVPRFGGAPLTIRYPYMLR